MTEAKQPVPELKPLSPDEAIQRLKHILALLSTIEGYHTVLPKARVLLRGIIGCGIASETQSPEPQSYCMNPDCIDGKVNIGCSIDAPLITTNCPQCNPPKRDWESNRRDIPVAVSPEPPSADVEALKKRAAQIIDAVVQSSGVVETRFFSQPDEVDRLETQIVNLLQLLVTTAQAKQREVDAAIADRVAEASEIAWHAEGAKETARQIRAGGKQ